MIRTIHIFACLFLLVLAQGAFAQAGPSFLWEKYPSIPRGISNPAVLAYRGALYVAGGNDARGGSNLFWKYDPLTGAWATLPAMPHRRYGHCAVIWNGKLLVIGGMEKEGTTERPLKAIDAFDFGTGHWYEHGTMPSWRTRFALVALNDKLMVIGGNDEEGRATADVQLTMPGIPIWKKGIPLPEPRARHQAVLAGGHVMVLGGEDTKGAATNSCLIYLRDREHWMKGRPMQRERKNFFAARMGDCVYVGGGWQERGRERILVRECEAYDTRTMQWNSIPPLDEGCDGIRAATLDGHVYLAGGYDGSFRAHMYAGHWQAPREDWRIDERLKFHLAFFDSQEKQGGKPGRKAAAPMATPAAARPSGADDEGPAAAGAGTPAAGGPGTAAGAGTEEHPAESSPPVPSLGLTPDHMPDITNITLKGICDLGFPLPRKKNAEKLAFYLKFYQYPGNCDSFLSAGKVAEPLQLFSLSCGSALRGYLRDPSHVLVKKGFIDRRGRLFTPGAPFPPFSLARIGPRQQQYLDSHIPFASLYVTRDLSPVAVKPGDEAREGRASAAGVLAVHGELLRLYRATFKELKGKGKDGSFTFIDDSQRDYVTGEPQQARRLRLPQAPLVFENFRDLPMPQDPHMYLTGLLLIYNDLLWLRGDGMEAASLLKTAPASSQVFEIGSVIVVKEPETP